MRKYVVQCWTLLLHVCGRDVALLLQNVVKMTFSICAEAVLGRALDVGLGILSSSHGNGRRARGKAKRRDVSC